MWESYEIRYFLGANSPRGFYSLYSELLPPETAEAVYILKGGPGCGKSTVMGQVAARLAQAGETVEYILCSGDPASLDGVVIPRLRTALVDGTAPHVVEPKYPGVAEQYVNLGACYDRAGLQGVREEIAHLPSGRACHLPGYVSDTLLPQRGTSAQHIGAALLRPYRAPDGGISSCRRQQSTLTSPQGEKTDEVNHA